MTSRRLLVFVALAILAVVGAVLLANQRTSSTRTESALLFPGLKAEAESIKAIRIYKAGDARAIELVRQGNEWTLTERDGFNAATLKARNLVRALAEAKILEEKTSDATRYKDLSVEDVSGADAKGARIELEGPSKPVNLIVGKDAPGAKSSYVRRVGDKQSWLVDPVLSASTEIGDWLQKDFLNISADRVQSATIATSGQKPYTASKATRSDASFKVEPLPKGKTLSAPEAADGVAGALTGLSLDDVHAKSAVAEGKATDSATFKTFDGLVAKVDGYKKGDKHFVVVATSYDAALAEQFRVKTAADETPKTTDATPAAAPAANVAEEAKSTGQRVEKWAYEIAEYKYQAIFKPLDEMLKK